MYSNNIPGHIIWLTHVLVGAYLIYLANSLQKGQLPPRSVNVLYVLGSLVILYHLHLWYNSKTLESYRKKRRMRR
jgi:hypothetical protein